MNLVSWQFVPFLIRGKPLDTLPVFCLARGIFGVKQKGSAPPCGLPLPLSHSVLHHPSYPSGAAVALSRNL